MTSDWHRTTKGADQAPFGLELDQVAAQCDERDAELTAQRLGSTDPCLNGCHQIIVATCDFVRHGRVWLQ